MGSYTLGGKFLKIGNVIMRPRRFVPGQWTLNFNSINDRSPQQTNTQQIFEDITLYAELTTSTPSAGNISWVKNGQKETLWSSSTYTNRTKFYDNGSNIRLEIINQNSETPFSGTLVLKENNSSGRVVANFTFTVSLENWSLNISNISGQSPQQTTSVTILENITLYAEISTSTPTIGKVNWVQNSSKTEMWNSGSFTNLTKTYNKNDEINIEVINNEISNFSGTITLKDTNVSGRVVAQFTYNVDIGEWVLSFNNISGKSPQTTNTQTIINNVTLYAELSSTNGSGTINWVQNSTKTTMWDTNTYSNQTKSYISNDDINIEFVNDLSGTPFSGTLTLKETSSSGRIIGQFTFNVQISDWVLSFGNLSGQSPQQTNLETILSNITLYADITTSTSGTINWIQNGTPTEMWSNSSYTNRTRSFSQGDSIRISVLNESGTPFTGTITLKETDGSGRSVVQFTYNVEMGDWVLSFDNLSGQSPQQTNTQTIPQAKTLYAEINNTTGIGTVNWIKNSTTTQMWNGSTFTNRTNSFAINDNLKIEVLNESSTAFTGTIVLRDTNSEGRIIAQFTFNVEIGEWSLSFNSVSGQSPQETNTQVIVDNILLYASIETSTNGTINWVQNSTSTQMWSNGSFTNVSKSYNTNDNIKFELLNESGTPFTGTVILRENNSSGRIVGQFTYNVQIGDWVLTFNNINGQSPQTTNSQTIPQTKTLYAVVSNSTGTGVINWIQNGTPTEMWNDGSFTNVSRSYTQGDSIQIRLENNLGTNFTGTITLKDTNSSGRDIAQFTYNVQIGDWELTFNTINGQSPQTTNSQTIPQTKTLYAQITTSTNGTVNWIQNGTPTEMWSDGSFTNVSRSYTQGDSIQIGFVNLINPTFSGTITLRDTNVSGRIIEQFTFSVGIGEWTMSFNNLSGDGPLETNSQTILNNITLHATVSTSTNDIGVINWIQNSTPTELWDSGTYTNRSRSYSTNDNIKISISNDSSTDFIGTLILRETDGSGRIVVQFTFSINGQAGETWTLSFNDLIGIGTQTSNTQVIQSNVTLYSEITTSTNGNVFWIKNTSPTEMWSNGTYTNQTLSYSTNDDIQIRVSNTNQTIFSGTLVLKETNSSGRVIAELSFSVDSGILVKTWTFDNNSEGWTGTSSTNLTTAYNTGELETDLSVGAFNETGYWRITNTYAALGVPSGATNIVSIRANYYYRYTTLNRFNTGSINFNINSTNLTSDITINAGTNLISTQNIGSWINRGVTPSTSFTLEFAINLQTGSGNPAGNRKGTVWLDDVTLEVEYE